MSVRHSVQRSNRVRLKADAVVLLDRIAATTKLSPRMKLEVAEMRMRLQPPVGVKAPIVLTSYSQQRAQPKPEVSSYREMCRDSDLWGKTQDCDGEVVSAGPRGGAKCNKCQGWFCF